MPIFWVETTAIHKIFYAVEAAEKPDNILERQINDGLINEAVQLWAGEGVESIREVTPEE